MKEISYPIMQIKKLRCREVRNFPEVTQLVHRQPLLLHPSPTAISLWVKPDPEKALVSVVPAWPLAESPALGAL